MIRGCRGLEEGDCLTQELCCECFFCGVRFPACFSLFFFFHFKLEVLFIYLFFKCFSLFLAHSRLPVTGGCITILTCTREEKTELAKKQDYLESHCRRPDAALGLWVPRMARIRPGGRGQAYVLPWRSMGSVRRGSFHETVKRRRLPSPCFRFWTNLTAWNLAQREAPSEAERQDSGGKRNPAECRRRRAARAPKARVLLWAPALTASRSERRKVLKGNQSEKASGQ